MPVIFDTDMDSDVDDVGALAQLHAMADAGEVTILGMMISGRNEWSAPCVDAINTYFGRPDIPIAKAARVDRNTHQDSRFAKEVAEAFPQDFDATQAPFADALYRQLLVQAADASVTIISVGDLTNLAALQDSGPDAASPLDGMALIKAKVAHYVCMGSRYPADDSKDEKRWGNFRTDPEATREVVEKWPGMLTFIGGGKFAESMRIGSKITEMDPQASPVSLAYRSYLGDAFEGKFRHTADSLTVLIAVRGFEPYFKVVDTGYNEIDELGRNKWHPEPDVENRRYVSELKNPADAPKLAALMEQLAMHQPGSKQ